MTHILIVGATSAIAKAWARKQSHSETTFYLLGRNEQRLEDLASDLKIRGAKKVYCGHFDASDTNIEEMLTCVMKSMKTIDIAFIAHGVLIAQSVCAQSIQETMKSLQINAISAIAILTYLANIFEKQHQGTIVILGSVAGDRGRFSNYVYGATKAALNTFAQGLRARLFHRGVNVITIKPGFVDTPMTHVFPKNFLWAKPETIAIGIDHAIKKNKAIAYLPFWWRWIMLVIQLIPEKIFMRLKI